MKKTVVVLPGDGIGPEVSAEAVRVLRSTGEMYGVSFDMEECAIGGASIDRTGMPVEDHVIEKCRCADAVFLGAVGGPKWDTLPAHLRPEAGLLKIRKELGLYANLRPVRLIPVLVNASSLKPEKIRDIDILVVRELTGGLYFGRPKLIEPAGDGERAVDTLEYHTKEIERIADVAFQSALSRKKKVTSVDKANVLASSQLWRKTADRISKKYPDVILEHMLVDNCAMQLIRNPGQFDVLLTENMFGDILSDEASMLTGSIGMLPSASLGEGVGLYEPVHGSAPDIAGRGLANPIAAVLSIALMFRYSFHMEDAASLIEKSIVTVLGRGYRTRDLFSREKGETEVKTSEMGDFLTQEIRKGRTGGNA